MFSSKKRQAQAAAAAQARQEAALASAGLGITASPARASPPAQVHSRTASSSTTASAVKPALVSPLQMTFDFELPPSPALSSPNAADRFADALLSQPERSEGTGLGLGGQKERQRNASLAPPILPHIRRLASREEGNESVEPEAGGVRVKEKSREERPIKPIIFAPIPKGREQVRAKAKATPSPPATQPRTSPPMPREEIWDRIAPPQPPPTIPTPPIPKEKEREREESDNISTKSSASRRSLSRIKSFITFDPPPDFLSSFSRTSSAAASPQMPSPPDPRPATASPDGTPQMESSLFPTREPGPAPQPRVDTVPAMTRAMIDARDKPYSQRPPSQGNRAAATLQQMQSSQDLQATAAAAPPSMTNNSSAPRSPLPMTPPTTTTFTRPSPSSAHTSPNLLRNPPTNYSGSTARSTLSSQSTAVDLPTIGTPYQQTSPSFPLPQHVATRPKTAGAPTATIAGVSVPTHHTSSFLRPETSSGSSKPDQPVLKTEKSERRKTRLLNPMALLSRRRSGQDEAAPSSTSRPTSTEQKAVQAAQAAALQRQRNVAAVGVSRLPEDFDPRIRGKVVHDFSAPRQPRRMWSYDDGREPAWNSVARSLQSANSAPYISTLDEGEGNEGPGAPPGASVRQSMHSNKHTSDSSSGKRSFYTGGMFMEHLSEDGHQQRIHAERLENKDFLQRVSRQSNVSQESAVLPPFARRSQVMDPSQAALFHADLSDESKRSSDPSSNSGKTGGAGERDSGVSSLSNVSPVTARSSAFAGHDARASLSPVSPDSPDKRGRPVSELSRPDSEVRPPSSYFSLSTKGPTFAVSPPADDMATARQSSQQGVEVIAEDEGETPRLPFSMQIPLPARQPPVIPPRSASASSIVVSPLNSPGSAPGSLVGSALPSPSIRSLPSNQPTPEPQVAEAVVGMKAPSSPPKLVEKRASAVGHAKRASAKSIASGNAGTPRHHVSNASRFSFQFGGSAAEEKLLEEKHRRIASNDDGVASANLGNGYGDDDEDFFDEDAMDDMDEMELQQQQATVTGNGNGDSRKSIAQFMYRTPTSNPKESAAASAWEREKARLELQLQAHDGSEGGEEDDEDGDEAPYWMHEDFQGYEDESRSESLGYHSREPSGDASIARGSARKSGGIGNGGMRRRGESGASLLTLDTNVGHGAVVEKARSGFYMQPVAAGYSPTAPKRQSQQAEKPTLPHRQSGNSERNRVASGLDFSSPTLGGMMHKVALSSSTVGSGMSSVGEERPFSQSTVGGSSSSEPRTLSTGLGLSGLSEFKFSDSAPASRPTSLPTDGKENRRTKDSETIPRDVDWTDHSGKPSPAPQGRESYGWSREGPSLAYNGAVGKGIQARKSSAVEKKQDLLGDDDDMYFDDGEFDQEINARPALGDTVDEDAFDDDRVFKNINGAIMRDQVKAQGHQRDLSALTITSLGSDGPYPSFAMPNPAKARERDSRLLLEDLPLQAALVDPKLIPQRNPSEDAKRLGLSSRVPPLPVHPGNADAIERVQASLLAYHAALADAANKAAADGRFLRMPSVTSTARSLSGRSNAEGQNKSPVSQLSRDDRSHSSTNEDGDMPAGGDVIADLDRNESVQTIHSMQDRSINHDPPKVDFSPPRMSFDFGFGSMPTDDASADDLDDFGNEDDIVAAANAEALASDDEGFYGQEFGFYAKARPNSGELQAVNGGFFGLDGDDGLMRNKSLKEPNLTPITERSEFSTRNSFISLSGPFGPPSAGPMSATSMGPISPALARLPVLPLGENEVTSFDQLRKLRAHAFGGSNVSLHSDGKGQPGQVTSDSPTLSTRSAAGAQGYFGPLGGAPMSFGYSTDSSGSSNPPSAHPVQQHPGFHGFQDSPHSAASSGHLPFSTSMEHDATPKRPLRESGEAPMTARRVGPAATKVQGHSRKSSKDSVTYIQEQDPAGTGQPRWVLERRRTSEQGQLELIAREIVQGGWI